MSNIEEAQQTAGDQPSEVKIDQPSGVTVEQPSSRPAAVPTTADNDAYYRILKRPIRYDPITIIFTVLVFIGGIIGYVKAGSTPSLVWSTVFAIALALSTYLEGARKQPYPVMGVLLALTFLMGYRWIKNGVFLPGGAIATLSLLLFARHAYLLYLRRKAAATSASSASTAQQ